MNSLYIQRFSKMNLSKVTWDIDRDSSEVIISDNEHRFLRPEELDFQLRDFENGDSVAVLYNHTGIFEILITEEIVESSLRGLINALKTAIFRPIRKNLEMRKKIYSYVSSLSESDRRHFISDYEEGNLILRDLLPECVKVSNIHRNNSGVWEYEFAPP